MNLPNRPSTKSIRTILCLAVILIASSLFLSIEPMASENSESLLPTLEQEEVTIVPLRARTPNIPVMPLHAKRQSVNRPRTVATADIETKLSHLSAEAEQNETTPVEPTEEPSVEPSEESTWEPEESESSWSEESDPGYYDEPSDNSSEDNSWEKDDEEDSVLPPPSSSSSQPSAGTYSDVQYLAAICQIEAGYDYEGCLAVANVILNRVNSGDFPSTIPDVIYQAYQFATAYMDYYLQNGTSASALQAAQAALAGENNIGDFLHFNGTTWLDPESLGRPYIVIGGNVFY